MASRSQITKCMTAIVRSSHRMNADEAFRGKIHRSRMVSFSFAHDSGISFDGRKYRTLVQQLDAVYPSQLSDKVIYRGVLKILKQFRDGDVAGVTPAQLHGQVEEFLNELEAAIDDYVVLVIVDGLDTKTTASLPLGRVLLAPYSPESDYAKAAQWEKEHRNVDPGKSPHFYFEGKGHRARVIENAVKAAEAGLEVFRLYNASWYRDRSPAARIPKRIGLRIASQREVTKVYALNADRTEIHTNWTPEHFSAYELTDRTIQYMQKLGIAQMNRLVTSTDSAQGDKHERVQAAVHWFAKGTYAESLADSYLMYAVALEALLSEGRTSQETYGRRAAALVARDTRFWEYGPFSRRLAEEFKDHSPTNLYTALVGRSRELFNFRNRIAHGLETSGDWDAIDKLIDFEAIARNAIFSFALGPWCSLKDYVAWLDTAVNVQFNPELLDVEIDDPHDSQISA